MSPLSGGQPLVVVLSAAAQTPRSLAEVDQTSRTETAHTGWPLERLQAARKDSQRVSSKAEHMGSQMASGLVPAARTGLQMDSEPVRVEHTGSQQPGRQAVAADSRQAVPEQAVPEKAVPEKLSVTLSLAGEQLSGQCSSELPV